MPDLGCEQAVVTQSLSGPPGDTALTGHRTAEPPSLLTGSAGAFPEAAMALPHYCTHCYLYPTPLCPEWGLQPGRHSSTHKPTQPIGSPVPPTWVSVWLLRTTNWTQPFPRRPLSTSRPLRAAIGFTGDGHPRRPLGAEASPHCKPALPHRFLPVCRRPGRQALPAVHVQTTCQTGRTAKTARGGHSPGPAQHKGVFDHDHWAQLRTLGVVVLAAVFTPCRQTASVRGRGTRGHRWAPTQWGRPTVLPTNTKWCKHRTCPQGKDPALWHTQSMQSPL